MLAALSSSSKPRTTFSRVSPFETLDRPGINGGGGAVPGRGGCGKPLESGPAYIALHRRSLALFHRGIGTACASCASAFAQLAQPRFPYISRASATAPDVAHVCRFHVLFEEIAFHVQHLRVLPPSTLKGASERRMEREL